jgi:RNA polymerase sigma-70 factor (ECF subfamily)
MLALVADYLRSDGDQRAEASQAWADFFPWCDGTIRRFAASFRSRGVDVDDCAQEVWTDLLTSLPNFKPDSSRGKFSSWLYSIVRSKSLDAVRRQSRRPTTILSPELAAQIRAGDSEPAQIAVCRENRQSVQRGLAKFAESSSERSRTILDMRYRQGQSAAQVAEALGISPQQVWTHEHRAKQKLRELLQNCA